MWLQSQKKQKYNGVVGRQLPAKHALGPALCMSIWDAAWTLWYLALAACVDVACTPPPGGVTKAFALLWSCTADASPTWRWCGRASSLPRCVRLRRAA